MKQLIIIGARGFGREVCNLAWDCISSGLDIVVKGFLDDNSIILNEYRGYPPILSSVENYIPCDDDVFICALGDVKWKRHYTDIIRDKGGVFTTLIHPSAIISKNSNLGTGCIVSRYVTISCDVKIGNFVTISTHAGIGHDSVVEDWCHIGSYTNLSGGVILKELVTLHPQANIVPHKTIGEGAVVGTGSVVLRSVTKYTTVFGNPAHKVI